MLRPSTCVIVTLWLGALAGCDNAAEQTPSDGPDAAPAATPEPASAERAEREHPVQHANEDQEALPLLPIMLRMSADMAGVMQALWVESYADMATHAGAIAAHAPISADELERIEAELGPEMPAFEAADEAVHEAAVRLHEAAKAEDTDSFLEHLVTVQRGCVGCHNRFRERLRTRPP